MNAPFTIEQFFNVFGNYNSSVFPAQIIILILGLVSLIMIHNKGPIRNYFILGFLGILWLWVGFAYHFAFFTSINKAAYGFAALFVLQGILFLVEVFRKKTSFSFSGKTADYIGYFFIIFGLAVYPVISYLLEGSYDRTISLGLPCPTTILTFGFLMLTSGKLSKHLLILPSIWAIIGTMAAINFGVYQDYLMIISAVIACVYLLRKKKSS